MTKKVIAFDLDDTLAISKAPISERMSELLSKLLDKYDVCVISGGAFERFKVQIIDILKSSPKELNRLHIMPTCGTKYFRFNEASGEWQMKYENKLTDDQKERAFKALKEGATKFDLWESNTYGDIIEDRGSQVTYSALGQQAPAEAKYAWDPTGGKKLKIRDYVAPLLPDLEVSAAGTTSVDVTMMGVNKGYGMKKLAEEMSISIDDILFIGDKLQEGGNDFPVKAIGIDTIEVCRWEDTALVIEGILGVTV